MKIKFEKSILDRLSISMKAKIVGNNLENSSLIEAIY